MIDPESLIDSVFIDAVKRIAGPYGLLGEQKILENGVVSVGSVVVDYNKKTVFISTPKARDDPKTQELAIALADAVGGQT